MTETDDSTQDSLQARIAARLGEHDRLNLHLVSAHSYGTALGLTHTQARAEHHYEHTQAATIAEHDKHDLGFDTDLAAQVLIETAQARGGDLDEAIEALLVPGQTTVEMRADEHTHDYTPGEPWTVCEQGQDCEQYPRTVDARRTVYTDGARSDGGAALITSRADDTARGLLAARSALLLMQAQNSDNGLGRTASTALATLDNTITLLLPVLYPDEAVPQGT